MLKEDNLLLLKAFNNDIFSSLEIIRRIEELISNYKIEIYWGILR
jgi:hypothetical protein